MLPQFCKGINHFPAAFNHLKPAVWRYGALAINTTVRGAIFHASIPHLRKHIPVGTAEGCDLLILPLQTLRKFPSKHWDAPLSPASWLLQRNARPSRSIKKWAPNPVGVPILQSAHPRCRFAKQITD
jgi:hypothetical protein